MHICKVAILWLHILLPVISILLTPGAFLVLAKAQQQRAKLLSNYINLRSRAALAAARARHPELYNRYLNRVSKLNNNIRTRREAGPDLEVKVLDQPPTWFINDAQRVVDLVHDEESVNFNNPATHNKQFISKNENPQAVFNAQNNKELVGSGLDQQTEALDQLQNMWNMNGFGNNQDQSTIIRESDQEFLGSPHFFSQKPKVHSKSVSFVKDKNTGATSFSFSSYDKWRNSKSPLGMEARQNDEERAALTNPEFETPEFKKWQKQKEEEALFNAEIHRLVNTPAGQFVPSTPRPQAHHDESKDDEVPAVTVNPEFLTPEFIKWQKEKEEEAKFNAAIQNLVNNPPRTTPPNPPIQQNQENNTDPPRPTTPNPPIQQNQENNTEAREARTFDLLDGKLYKLYSKKLKLLEKKMKPEHTPYSYPNQQYYNGNYNNEQYFRSADEVPQPEMVQEEAPEARTLDLDKKLYKIYVKKLKILGNKLNGDDDFHPASYYSTQSGYYGYGGDAGYARSAENEDSGEENPEMMGQFALELEEENKNFPDHDPNHPGHADGRCAEIDNKLFKVYKKKLDLLYKKIEKKTDSVPYIEPYYDGQYNNGYYSDDGAYNRNSGQKETQRNTNSNVKTAVNQPNSTDSKVGEATPEFFSQNEQSPPFFSHPVVRDAAGEEINEESLPDNQFAREPHFKGGFSHSHSLFIKKDLVHPPPPPFAPIQINVNANSLAHATAGGPFQNQHSSANSFASSGSQSNFGSQQSSASFANAAASSGTSHHFVRAAEGEEKNEESLPENPAAREPHFNGGFSHGHSLFFKKDFGGSAVASSLPPPPGAPIAINLNANSFANAAAGGSFQNQQSGANSFASSGSQSTFGSQQSAKSFANAAASSGAFQQQQSGSSSFANAATGGSFQNQESAANSFASSGSQSAFGSQQSAANSFSSSGSQSAFGSQQSAAKSFANTGTRGPFQQQLEPNAFANAESFSNSGPQPAFDSQPVVNANAAASAGSFQHQNGFSNAGAFGQQAGNIQFNNEPAPVWENRGENSFAQANAQASFNSGFFPVNEQKSLAGAQASANSFQQGPFSSGAQSFAQSQANSFTQSPVTFDLGSNSQSFASASAKGPWLREESPSINMDLETDKEKKERNSRSSSHLPQEMPFVTNIVDQSSKFGSQGSNPELFNNNNDKATENRNTDQTVAIINDQEKDANKKEGVVNTMNFVTGIVDFGLSHHDKNKQRNSRSSSHLPEEEMSFVTNIVDQSLKIGSQLNNQKELHQTNSPSNTRNSDQGLIIRNEEQDSKESINENQRSIGEIASLSDEKKSVFDTMNFVTGIVDFGLKENDKNSQRSSAGPITRLLDGGLRLKRQIPLPINGEMEQFDNQFMLQNFRNMPLANQMRDQFQSMPRQNFFLNEQMQNTPENVMFDQFSQMGQRNSFPAQIERQRDTGMINTLAHEINENLPIQQQNNLLGAFPQMNNQLPQFHENFNQQGMTDNQQIPNMILSSEGKPNIDQQQKPNTNFDNNQETHKHSVVDTLPQKEISEESDEIITAPLPSHLKDDSSEEQDVTKLDSRSTTERSSITAETIAPTIHAPVAVPGFAFTTQSSSTEPHHIPKHMPVKNEGGVSSKNPKPTAQGSMLDILHKSGISEVFKIIDEELKMLTPEQKQQFVKQELELLTEMVVETLKKNGSEFLKTDALNNTTQNSTVNQSSLTSPDPIVSNIIQAPYDVTARESIYNRPEYLDDSTLRMQNLQNQFDTILGAHQESIHDIKEKAENDKDLLMISWIGEGIVKDLENRRDKSSLKKKRDIPVLKSDMISMKNLVSDPKTKIDVPNTFNNLGAVTRHVIENSKAPMYHVRSMLGNAKDSVMAAVKAAPNNLIIPSKYEIANIDETNKVGSINKKLLKEKIIEAAEHKKKYKTKASRDSFGIADTFSKLGNILKESVDSGKQSVSHVNDLATDARNAYFTAKHAVPKIITPSNPLSRLSNPLSSTLPEKAVLLVPRILEVTENNNLLGEELSENNDHFLGLGNILDSVGVTNPDNNDIDLEKMILQPETVQIIRKWNKGIPKDLRSSAAIKSWFLDTLQANQPNQGDDNNILGDSIDQTLESLEETEKALDAKSLKEMLQKLRLQMKNAVKDHLESINKQRRKLRKARIMQKYRGIPTHKNITVKADDEKRVTTEQNFLPDINSQLKDATVGNENVKFITEDQTGVTETSNVLLSSTSFPIETLTVTEHKEIQMPLNLVTEHQAFTEKNDQMPTNLATEHQAFTEKNENLDENLGLYLTPDLLKPFMGRASENQLNEFWRENNDLEDIKPLETNDKVNHEIALKLNNLEGLKPKEKLEHPVTTTTTSLPIITEDTSTSPKNAHDFDNDALTHILGAMNPRMFEKFFNERVQSTSVEPIKTEDHTKTDHQLENQKLLSSNPKTETFQASKPSLPPVENPMDNVSNLGLEIEERTTVFNNWDIVKDTTEKSEENDRARFHMIPSGGIYKNPFMGTLDKKLIKKFLKKYNNIEDSSSEEQKHYLAPEEGYVENEVYNI